MGGMPACRRLSSLFHAAVAADQALARLFPKDLAPATERLALYLAEQLGGPSDYSARRGRQSLACRHAHLPIGRPEAHAWLDAMFASLASAGIPVACHQELRAFFGEVANGLSDSLRDLYQLGLEDLRLMLTDHPALASAATATGRTLLSEAAGRWDLARVSLLLEFGADALARDVLGHDALSRAAIAVVPGREMDGAEVAAMLVERGAEVNGRSGPGRNTPLHSAARRGTLPIAIALLDAGADLEARDAKGETPLRRAVNCGQGPMVGLLLERGADPLSRDRRGRTVVEAARTEGIRRLLAVSAD